jgi:hypothetical protein
MTTSAIAVTPGSGANIWTDQRTVSAVAREAQYVLLGEPALATYSVIAEEISIATAADHVLQIMAGASNYVRIHYIMVEQAANATTAAARAIELVRLTTAGTGGGAVTPRPFDTGDAAAGATAMTLPTVKGTEGVKLLRAHLLFRQAVAATAAQIDDIWEWTAHPRGKPIIIPAGAANGIAIKNVTATAAATANVTVIFTETAWL